MKEHNEIVATAEIASAQPAKPVKPEYRPIDRDNYNSFRKHSEIHHHLRLHHAIYLDHLIEMGGGWKYEELSDWMKSTLNRFFELVDRVALTRQKAGSWRDGEADKIIAEGEKWIESLFCVTEILTPDCNWGSTKTDGAWNDLRSIITNLIEDESDLEPQSYPADNGTNSIAYEIFSGGFEYVPTIATFPFYLFGERLGAWGIVEYGRLDALAMATNAVTLKNFGFNAVPLPVPIGVEGGQGTYEGVAAYLIKENEFSKLFKSAQNKDTYFHYLGAGHAAVSLLLRILKPETFISARKRIVPLGGECISELLLANKRAIVLCDLGDKSLSDYVQQRPDKAHNDNRRLLVLKDLDVPVGFGFSLASLPLLLSRKELFTKLVEAIRKWRTNLMNREDAKNVEFYDGITVASVEDIPLPWKPAASRPAGASSQSAAPDHDVRPSKTVSNGEDGRDVTT
jgi:hypothetical protein